MSMNKVIYLLRRLPYSCLKAGNLGVNLDCVMISHPAHYIVDTIHTAIKFSCLCFNYCCQSFDHSLTPFLVRILQSGCGLHH